MPIRGGDSRRKKDYLAGMPSVGSEAPTVLGESAIKTMISFPNPDTSIF